MPRNESLYPSDWRRIAEKDFVRSLHITTRSTPLTPLYVALGRTDADVIFR